MDWMVVGIGLVLAGFILVVFINIMFPLLFEKLLFQHGPVLEPDHQFDFPFLFQEQIIEIDETSRVHGLLLKSHKQKGLILYFHGNRGHVGRWGSVGQSLVKHGYDVLVVDYRGYGKSRGKRTEENLYSDAQAAYDFAKTSLGYKEIVIYGRSLGTAIATELSRTRACNKLILETPMTCLRDVMSMTNSILFSDKKITYEFDSVSRINDISASIYIIHGTSDRVVSFRLGKKLYDAISSTNKKLIQINGGGHNNLNNFEVYQKAMDEILN